ncbi:MAG: four helix bundle protein [Bacilli bacterium]|nr:four helix bundle protein [Bacilli bacterium]
MDKYKLYNLYDDLIYYTHNILKKYPQDEKTSLVLDIKNNTYEGMKLIILIFKSYNNESKINNLNLLDVNIKMLCFLIRLSYKNKYINKRNYYVWSNKLNNINNIIGEYIKLCLKH